MSNVKTGWSRATKDPHVAMVSLMDCLNRGTNAWIECRDNGDQDYPILIPNPVLEDPFKWQFAYGTPGSSNEEIEKHNFLNDTQRDLTMNWVAMMGTPEAVAAYKKDRTLMKGLMGGSICCPVRREDAERYRAEIVGDNYLYRLTTDWWKPLNGIPYHIPDPSVGKVFTVCYDDGAVDIAAACHRAAEFLIAYKNYYVEQQSL